MLGRLASGRLGGAMMARMGSTRPFPFLCEFSSFDVARSRAVVTEELARRDGGPLGLLGTREIVISARDPGIEQEHWQRLLDPVRPEEPCRWELGDGPAIRLVEGKDDGIQAVVWEVDSLSRAADWLRAEGWLDQGDEGRLSIAAEPLQGLEVWLMSSS